MKAVVACGAHNCDRRHDSARESYAMLSRLSKWVSPPLLSSLAHSYTRHTPVKVKRHFELVGLCRVH